MNKIDQKHRFDHEPFMVTPGMVSKLSDFDPGYIGQIENKKQGKEALAEDIKDLSYAQELLWASSKYSLLIIFQAMDAAGKDGTIKHVMTGVNPQGCNVYSFKAPNAEERKHHFLWRPFKYLPERGMISIFNRSYYEEVLVTRVHNEFLDAQYISPQLQNKSLDVLWEGRYKEINDIEQRWDEHGIEIIKFFLNVSKEEQRKRFLQRLKDPGKQWKFTLSDYNERKYWDDYQKAYEDMLNATSTSWAPWYVVPADNKWYMRAVVADIISYRIKKLDLQFPDVSEETKAELKTLQKKLKNEEGKSNS